MKNYKILLVLIITFFSLNLSAQSTLGNFKKNSVYSSAGTWLFYVEGELTYERIHKKFVKNGKSTFIGSQFSVGLVESFADGGSFKIAPGAILLRGNGRSHLETTVGCNMFLLEDSYDMGLKRSRIMFNEIDDVFTYFSPKVGIGYRYQNMEKSRMIFRAGVEWPKGLYAGIGWNF